MENNITLKQILLLFLNSHDAISCVWDVTNIKSNFHLKLWKIFTNYERIPKAGYLLSRTNAASKIYKYGKNYKYWKQ